MANRAMRLRVGSVFSAFLVPCFFVATTTPCAAQSANVSELFGARVEAVAGVKSPLMRGDYDGDGKADAVYFVKIAPAGDGKSVASDVHVISIYHSEALSAQSSGHGLAIVLNNGQKFLAVDFEQGAQGFFDAPSWADIGGWDKTSPPPHSAKRGSAELKTYPCLGKGTKGDVILLRDEAGIDEALAWTGKTFKMCVDPNNDP
ncbi:hypothetical protein [Methylocapsa sp. S129]|uniref:hypothetical protein n=1 Tax=Methylocapsa sp. S129 TaxID=1641869 RepID=UPI00131E3E4E|nr:hypothetical protein [Methylocapsa sp. S129]